MTDDAPPAVPVRLRSSPAAPPYGAAVLAGAYVPDPDRPDRVALVRDLFARYADGEPLPAIAAALDAAGPPPARGGRWRAATVLRTVGHGAYRALVDPETWARAQLRRQSPWLPPRPGAGGSWLEGVVFHACGAPMGLRVRRGPNGENRDGFRCNRRGCGAPRPYVSRRKLEAAVLAALRGDARMPPGVVPLIAEGKAREAGQALRRAGARVDVAEGAAWLGWLGWGEG